MESTQLTLAGADLLGPSNNNEHLRHQRNNHSSLAPEEEVFLSAKIGSLSQFEHQAKLVSQDTLCGYDKDGHTLAHWAAKREDSSFLRYLLTLIPAQNFHLPSNDDVGMYPIHWAVTNDSIPNIAFLLSTALHDEEELLELRDKSGCTPLLVAAQYGHADVCAFLLKRGADICAIDNSSDGAIHWASYKGSINVVGLLCYFQASIDDSDIYGHSPLHLSSLRGHTEVVQYLLEECESRMSNRGRNNKRDLLRSYLLHQDKDGKTPKDNAIQKNKRGCQSILQDWEDRYQITDLSHTNNHSRFHTIKIFSKQICSLNVWKMWMGMNTASTIDEVTFSQQKAVWPMGLTIIMIILAFYMYPWKFLSSDGLYGYTFLHLFTLLNLIITCIFFFLTWKTNPGMLGINDNNSQAMAKLSKELKFQYETTLEYFAESASSVYNSSSTASSGSPQLCHSCHILRPPRSKHCRVQRRCVLMFDHYCPFVGNTIGLYNYPYFVAFLLFISLSEIGFSITWFIYMKHITSQRSFDLFAFFTGVVIALFMLPCASMAIYHTTLIVKNLTTNEHQNFF